MKRLILMTMLCLSTAVLPAAHIPGQLQDTVNSTRSIERGVIMQTIMTDTNFAAELNAIQTFIGAGRTIPSYQEILQLLQQSRSAAPSIAVIEAFEKAIMHAYDYDSYMIGSYKPCMSMFVTGIKWPSMMLNPWYWFGRDQLLDSCLKEMDALVKIAWRHSTATSNRMKLVVHSYRHWRRNLLLTVALIAAATQSGTVIAGGKAAIAAPVKMKDYLVGCLPFRGASDNHHQITDKVNTPLATAPNPKTSYARGWLSFFSTSSKETTADTIAQPVIYPTFNPEECAQYQADLALKIHDKKIAEKQFEYAEKNINKYAKNKKSTDSSGWFWKTITFNYKKPTTEEEVRASNASAAISSLMASNVLMKKHRAESQDDVILQPSTIEAKPADSVSAAQNASTETQTVDIQTVLTPQPITKHECLRVHG